MASMKMIVFLVTLAIVMMLTGSIVINMYGRISEGDNEMKGKLGFHWWVGLSSIVGGVLASVVTVLLVIYPERTRNIKLAALGKDVPKKVT